MHDIRKRSMVFSTMFIVILLVTLVLFFIHWQKTLKSRHEIMNQNEITLDRENLSGLLQDTLKNLFPVQSLQAEIGKDGAIRLSAFISKEEFKNFMQQYDLPFQPALPFLSDPIPLKLSFRLESSHNSLSIYLLKFEVAEINLTELLNAHFFDEITRVANERLNFSDSNILSFQAIPGGFSIQFRQ